MGPEVLMAGGAILIGIAILGIFMATRKGKEAPTGEAHPASSSAEAPEPAAPPSETILKVGAPPPPPPAEKKKPVQPASAGGRARMLAPPPTPIANTIGARAGISASGGARTIKKSSKLEEHHPRTLGKYELLETLGEGGMATVFHARDQASGKDVAIKLIHEHLQRDSEFLQRFEREMKVSRALVHPNIVRVFNVGQEDEKLYMVMELMDGGDLEELTPELGMDPAEMVQMAVQVCAGLHYAHERGLIHRDIKPSNVMTNAQGVPKVLDFGLALGQGMNRFTQVGMAMGTPTHMAPEVLTTGNGDVKSDQYSLGVVFYQMLTGKCPFEGEDAMQIGLQHVKVPPPSIRAQKPNVSAKLEAIILKMLAKSPNDRFASLEEVEKELQASL